MAHFANQGLDHVAIGVADVDRSASFYREVVGIAHSVYLSDPDGHRLELTTYEV